MSRSLVLLPTYNERENIPRVLPRLHAIEQDLDIIVIDDASPDGTGILAEALVSDYPRLSVLHRAQKDGLGRAYVEGMKEALRRGYSRIVTMDADLSHAPEDVPRLLSALDDAEVAVGSRHVPGGGVEGWPPVRRLLSRAGSIYARVALGIPASDTTSGFRAYRAEALRAIDLESIRARGFVFQVEILRRILDLPGARVREVPICFRNRLHGRSKLTLGIIGEAATEVLRLRSRKVLPPNVVRNHAPQEDNQAPLVSVIVPLRLGAPEPRAIEALASISYPRDRLEVIIVRGECPARQRNLAARQARGDLLLFLDDDSVPSRGLFKAYREAFSREPELAAAGGPAVYTASGFGERLCAAVLSEPLVTGRSASRYSVRGASRLTDELELILANLAVRRSSFEAAGGFEEALYPNEENLFLDRLRQRGEKARYEPGAGSRPPAPGGCRLRLRLFSASLWGSQRSPGPGFRSSYWERFWSPTTPHFSSGSRCVRASGWGSPPRLPLRAFRSPMPPASSPVSCGGFRPL